jgi:hypothetical protein
VNPQQPSPSGAADDQSVSDLIALANALPERINADPDKVEQGLARLVLTVIELLRRVLEHQAVRRMDGGSLSDEQIERLGLALLKLNERMDQLKKTFDLTDDDLSIDLGLARACHAESHAWTRRHP